MAFRDGRIAVLMVSMLMVLCAPVFGQDGDMLRLRPDTVPGPPEPPGSIGRDTDFEEFSDELRELLERELSGELEPPEAPEVEGPESLQEPGETDTEAPEAEPADTSPKAPETPPDTPASSPPEEAESPGTQEAPAVDPETADTRPPPVQPDRPPRPELELGTVEFGLPERDSIRADSPTEQPVQLSYNKNIRKVDFGPVGVAHPGKSSGPTTLPDWRLVGGLWVLGLLSLGGVYYWLSKPDVEVINRLPGYRVGQGRSKPSRIQPTPERRGAEEERALRQVLNELNLDEDFREALRMYLFEEVNQEEILRRSGLNRRQLKTLLHRIQRKL